MTRLTWPNRITITRILLIGPFVVALLNLRHPTWGETARWVALAIYALMAISDALDGYLARKLNQESAAGRFLDPLADKLLILSSVVLLANQGTHIAGKELPSAVAVVAIWKDLCVVVGFLIVYFITSQIHIEPRMSGKLCTTLQLLTVLAVLLSPDLPGLVNKLPVVLWWAATAMALFATVDYYRVGMHFIHEFEEKQAARAAGADRSG